MTLSLATRQAGSGLINRVAPHLLGGSLILEHGTMTKRDMQASDYAAESYEKTPAERGVSATFDLISDATDFLLEMATRRVARTHYEGCRKDHVECLVAALVDAVTRLRDATPTTHATPAEGSVRSECTLTDEERAALLTAADLLIGSKPGVILRKLLERTK